MSCVRADTPKRFESRAENFSAKFPGEVKTLPKTTGKEELNIAITEDRHRRVRCH
jgi:hypothetical protein